MHAGTLHEVGSSAGAGSVGSATAKGAAVSPAVNRAAATATTIRTGSTLAHGRVEFSSSEKISAARRLRRVASAKSATVEPVFDRRKRCYPPAEEWHYRDGFEPESA